jgi:hypothetical protein
MKKISNPCIRCGKERIVSKTYKTKTENGSVLICTETVCPDPECQKKVDSMLSKERKKRKIQKKESEERERLRHQKKSKKRK